jgi:hypothetical protein
MVQRASEAQAKAWAALPSRTQMAFRRISSVFLMSALLTILTPFRPFSWIIPVDGPELLDAFLAPVLIIGALFFQWRIAGVVAPFTIEVLDNVFIYKHDNYWPLAFFEVVLAVAVGYGQNEICRRFAAVGSVAGLWLIGWFCTPLRYKLEAWEHLKWIWTWMAFEQGTRLMHGQRGGRRRY